MAQRAARGGGGGAVGGRGATVHGVVKANQGSEISARVGKKRREVSRQGAGVRS